MKQLLLQAGCQWFYSGNSREPMNTTGSNSLLTKILQGCAQLNHSSVPVYIDIIETDERSSADTDSGAVMYIVAVLVFYSAGIVIMIIKYLRREKRELEEERILEDFFRSMPAYKKEREQNNVNRVAIQAFHALTSFSYDDVEDDSISTDNEEARGTINRAETIHEVENEQTEHYVCNSDVLFSNEDQKKETVVNQLIDTNMEVTNQCDNQCDNISEEHETML